MISGLIARIDERALLRRFALHGRYALPIGRSGEARSRLIAQSGADATPDSDKGQEKLAVSNSKKFRAGDTASFDFPLRRTKAS